MSLNTTQVRELGRPTARLVESHGVTESPCRHVGDVCIDAKQCGCSVVFQFLHRSDGPSYTASGVPIVNPCVCGGAISLVPIRVSRIACESHIESICNDCVTDGIAVQSAENDRRQQEADAARADEARSMLAAKGEAARRAELARIRAIGPEFPSVTGCGCRVIVEDGEPVFDPCEAHAHAASL